MNLKLKVLSFTVLVAMGVWGVNAMEASSNGGGHFVSEFSRTVVGSEGGSHKLHLVNHGLEGEIGCAEAVYTSTLQAATTSSVLITPFHEGCTTTGDGKAVSVDVNECKYRFTVAEGTTDSTEQTAHLECPAGKAIQVTHPNCTISIHPQTLNTGLTYTRVTNATTGVDEITVDVKIQFTTTRHGLCQFIVATNGNGTLSGSVTAQAIMGNQISLTAT
ncbi:MAG TPA: hypothetical protein VF729_04395 [Solirubrobacterales bacterium]